MRDDEHSESAATGEPVEPLTVESLDAERPARVARALMRGVRLPAWLGELAPAWAGTRLSARARALRVGVVVALVAATFFALLGGPALLRDGWISLYGHLTGADRASPLTMSPWRVIPPPPTPLLTTSYTPDPTNPQRVFACAVEGASISVWVTDTGGRAWRDILESGVDSPVAVTCQVKIALNAPVVALAVVHARAPASAGCERLALFALTDLGSGSLPLPYRPAACLGDAWPSAASLYYWWTNNSQGALALSGLERSDDLGATWHEVSLIPPDDNYSLAPALLDSGSGDTLITQVYSWQVGQRPARNELWRSLDGGNTWRRAPNAPLGAQIITTTDPNALIGSGWPPTYAAIFSGGELSPPWEPAYPPAALAALQPDGASWRAVPPLPLRPSQAPQRPAPTGVFTPLAVGPGGDLLVLGQQPGAVATINTQPHLWLWAWDPALAGWRVGLQAPDGARLAGVTWAPGPAGGPYARTPGMYLWLASVTGGQASLSWTFIPATQA